jgi:hypothetical protein
LILSKKKNTKEKVQKYGDSILINKQNKSIKSQYTVKVFGKCILGVGGRK